MKRYVNPKKAGNRRSNKRSPERSKKKKRRWDGIAVREVSFSGNLGRGELVTDA